MTIATALAMIAMAGMPAPPVVPPVIADACQREPYVGRSGCTWPGGPIYAHPAGGRQLLLHELGHQFDYQAMHEPQRLKFQQLVGDEGEPWDAGDGSSAEKFAEAYRTCIRRGPLFFGRVWADEGYAPTLRRHRRICLLIRRAGLPL